MQYLKWFSIVVFYFVEVQDVQDFEYLKKLTFYMK